MNKYEEGEVISGVVTGIEKYGIFLLLDDNTTGLIHISEISDFFVRNISDYVELNEKIFARVLEYDEKEQHLKLSIKNLNYRGEVVETHGIQETKSGFQNLEKSLEEWIENKLHEMP